MGPDTFAIGALPVGPFTISVVGIGAFVAGELGDGEKATVDFSAGICLGDALDDRVFLVEALEVGLALLWSRVGV